MKFRWPTKSLEALLSNRPWKLIVSDISFPSTDIHWQVIACLIRFLSSFQICSSTGWSTAALSTAPFCITKRAAYWTSVTRTTPTWSTLSVSWARWPSCLETLCPLCSWTKLDAWGCWVSERISEMCCFSSMCRMLANFLFSCSRLQCDLLRQLLLPVVWEQRVGHDRSAVSVWGNQHCVMECPGCTHGRTVPIW